MSGTPGASPMVAVEDLVKIYPRSSVVAVDGISFSVDPGEIFGLLGPNGAGKTTTIGVLTTRTAPTSGRALVAGIDVVADPVAARRHLGVVPQRNNLDRSLSVRQNLLFHAAYHGVPPAVRKRRAEDLLEQFGVAGRAGEKVDFFSGGQMQRVMIARALMHAPDVLFLDEPATGLDPAAKLFVWDRIDDLRKSGVTMLLTTHDMDEAATLCDRVGIMDHGHILALDPPGALTKALPGRETIEIGVAPLETRRLDALAQRLGALEGVERAEVVGIPQAEPAPGEDCSPAATPAQTAPRRIRLSLSAGAPALVAPVAACVSSAGASLVEVRLGAPSLEDVFIHLTGRSLR